MSLSRLSLEEQAFATKLLTRWLPTGHRVEKYGGAITVCHRCREDQTVDHLFLCRHQSEWRSEFLERLDSQLQAIGTEQDIRRALHAGITHWLQANEENAQGNSTVPPSMVRHMQWQQEVGWNLTFCGLLDENWAAAQEHYCLRKARQSNEDNGLAWNVKLCTWMIKEARQVWHTRNQEVHQSDNRNSKFEQEIYVQVQRSYTLQDDRSQQDRAILDEPIEEKLKQPIKVLQQWVRNTGPVRNRCIKEYQEK